VKGSFNRRVRNDFAPLLGSAEDVQYGEEARGFAACYSSGTLWLL